MTKRTLSTKEKYDRLARRYDVMEFFPESLLFGRFRRNLFAMVKGDTLLEIGVGTGKNLPYYPPHMRITAIDFSEEMMKKAEQRGKKLQTKVDFQIMDIESLGFENDRFDAVAATFVFCSVPDPLKGLAEVKRVLKSEGKFYALEHVRPKGKLLGSLFDRIAPAVADRTGVHINRNTVDNIRNAGFTIELEKDLLLDVFKMIVAKPKK